MSIYHLKWVIFASAGQNITILTLAFTWVDWVRWGILKGRWAALEEYRENDIE